VHAARDGLERLDRLAARLALPEPRQRQVEQRGRGLRAVEHAGAEDAPRLAQRDHRHELPLGPDAAQRQRAVHRRAEAEQARELGGAVGEIGEPAADGQRRAGGTREVLEPRLRLHPLDPPVGRREAFDQRFATRFVAKEGDLGAAVELRDGLRERQQRALAVGGGAEGVGERGERARGRRHAGRSGGGGKSGGAWGGARVVA
jgi:hypothetical protein